MLSVGGAKAQEGGHEGFSAAECVTWVDETCRKILIDECGAEIGK